MSRKVKTAITLLFVLSGVTGLVYETLWIRILSLGVGSTSQSMSVVLSIFFLGLSLGSYLSGKRSSLIKRPLQAYGILEILLAVAALGLIYPLFNLHKAIALLPLVGSLSWLGATLKFLIVAILLLVPTICMGATLPLIVRVFSKDASNEQVSKLYALNTVGAVLGAFGTGYFLIPQFGIVGTNLFAVLINIIIGGIAFFVGRKIEIPVEKVKTITQNVSSPLQSTRWILISTFICGFISIAFEVLWNKYLNIFFGTNLYGIGLVLALFLLGIALGSWLLSFFVPRLEEKQHLLPRVFVSLFGATLVALVFATMVLNSAPKLSVLMYYLLNPYVSLIAAKTLVITLILAIPTSLFGALFPLVILILSKNKREASSTVGMAYSVNTVGAILGSYVTGMILIPHLGSSVTVRVLLISAALTFLWLALRTLEGRAVKITASVFTLLIAVFTLKFASFDFKNLIKSAYHQQTDKITTNHSTAEWLHAALKPFDTNYEDFKAVFEGETAIITLSHDPSDGKDYKQYLRLKTSGLNESVYDLDNLEELPKYEALVGFLPYLFSRSPKEAFVVGYGGGYTVDFLTSTDLKKVNVVELEGGILKAANYVYKGNNPIIQRPTLNLQIEDARFVLTTKQLTPQDIIVSQPSHSWLPGASNLFTKEFFEIVKENLSERGIFSQWLNLYNMDTNVLRSILKTFFSVFPEGAVFTQLEDQELILLGSKKPLELNLAKMELIQKNSILKKKLAQVFGKSSYDLLSLYSVSRKDTLPLTVDTPLNTDRNAYAEVKQSQIFYAGLKGEQTPQQYLSSLFNGDFSPIVRNGDTPEFYQRVLFSLAEGNQYDKFYAIFNRYEEKVKDKSEEHWNLGYLALKAQRYQTAYNYLSEVLKKRPNVEVLNLLLKSLSEMGRYSELIKVKNRFPSLRNEITDCFVLGALNEMGERKQSKVLERGIAQNVSGYRAVCGAYVNKILGAHYLLDEKPKAAIPFLEAFYGEWSTDVANLERMVEAYRKSADESNERIFNEYLSQVKETERKRLQLLVDYYLNSGHAADALILSNRISDLSQQL